MLERKTETGDIRFSKSVIVKIINDAVTLCDGKVTLQNFKGKYKSVIPGGEEIRITELSDGMHIDIFVVIRFGASIRENTKKIISYIDENVYAVMGEKPARVKVIITGIQSRATARRHIEISSRRNVSNPEGNTDGIKG